MNLQLEDAVDERFQRVSEHFRYESLVFVYEFVSMLRVDRVKSDRFEREDGV